jgi:glycosyltransferase involved in cell wall biosynthesis
MPTVSVIIPTYNYAHFLATAIESVLNQTYTDFELIVVDDGSTDNTKQVVAAFQSNHQVQYVFQSNQGDAAARNTGIRQSSGKYLAFLDSDDAWTPDKLQIQTTVLEQYRHYSIVYSAVIYQIFQQKQLVSSRIVHKSRRYEQSLYEDLLYQNTIIGSHSGVVVRREAFEKLGLFDEAFHICDLDLWRRFSEFYNFYYVPQALVYIRKHDTNLSRNRELIADNYARYIQKLNRDLPKHYRYHLPRVSAMRFGYFAIGFLQDRKISLAIYWGLKALKCAWRCPFFCITLIPRVCLKVLERF